MRSTAGASVQAIVWVAPPSGLRVRYSSATKSIALQWQAAPGAQSYQLQLADDAGAPVPSQPAFAISGDMASCGPLSLTSGQRYRVQAAAQIGDQASGSISTPFTPRDLAAPAGLTCTGDRTTLRATGRR